MTSLPDTDTRTRILDAAEALFAKHGLAGTSVRAITLAARANVSAVKYYFGGKDALLDAVFARQLQPLETERREGLEAVLSKDVTLESVLKAYLAPAIHRVQQDPDGDVFLQLLSRLYTESSEIAERVSATWFRPTVRRYLTVLATLLPELEESELKLRFHFLIGVLSRTGMIHHRLPSLIGRQPDSETLVQALIDFTSAGMRSKGTK